MSISKIPSHPLWGRPGQAPSVVAAGDVDVDNSICGLQQPDGILSEKKTHENMIAPRSVQMDNFTEHASPVIQNSI